MQDWLWKDPNELPEGSTLTEAGTVNEMPATTKVQAEAQAANIQAPNNAAITDEQLAGKL